MSEVSDQEIDDEARAGVLLLRAMDQVRKWRVAAESERERADNAELHLEEIALNFDEDLELCDLVAAVDKQTKELDEMSCWWHFANEALCLLPGMIWDEDDCESLVPNAKRCIEALTTRLARHECIEHDPPQLGMCAVCDEMAIEDAHDKLRDFPCDPYDQP